MIFAKPSMVTKALLCVGLCMSSVPALAQANPCVAGAQGCVLPLPEAVAETTTTTTVTPMVVEEPKTLGILPILAGLAALGLLAYLLLNDDDEDDDGVSVSP